eukprot:1242219-Prymnesium_polylepis.1
MAGWLGSIGTAERISVEDVCYYTAGKVLTFSRTSRNVAHAKRRHVVRRVRPRARPASAGRALELSGRETAAGIECDAPVAAKLSDRPNDKDIQAVCRRHIDVLIG